MNFQFLMLTIASRHDKKKVINKWATQYPKCYLSNHPLGDVIDGKKCIHHSDERQNLISYTTTHANFYKSCMLRTAFLIDTR